MKSETTGKRSKDVRSNLFLHIAVKSARTNDACPTFGITLAIIKNLDLSFTGD